MSGFVDATPLVLLVALTGIAAMSGLVMARSVEEEAAVSAWAFAGSFVLAALLTALFFWRVV